MIRTLHCMSLVPPRRRIFCCSMAFRSLAWSSSFISPISSRKRVPSSASSKSPFLVAAAPVKAPFSYPNNSLSIRVSGKAAQLNINEGFGGSRTSPMNQGGGGRFSGSGLTDNQYHVAGAGGAADVFVELYHCGADADHLLIGGGRFDESRAVYGLVSVEQRWLPWW